MRIGIDAREFQMGRITGIGRYLRQFLVTATARDDSHDYVLFLNQKSDLPFDHPNIKKVVIPEKLTPVWDQFLLPRQARREKIDVFLTPYFKTPLFMPVPRVIIINDLIPLFFPEEHGLMRRAYFRLMCARTARKAARILTISQNSKDDIVRILKIPDDKIDVVHLGVEERFRPDSTRMEEIRRKYNLPQHFILYVGNLSPHKNIHGLIKAFESLPSDLKKQYKLVLSAARNNKDFTRSKTLMQKLDLAGAVHLTGFIDEEDLPGVYSQCSLFVFPSLYEGFGLPPLEAMACGCPVASSDTSSLPEVLGKAAFYFDPHNIEDISRAMKRMLEDKSLRGEHRRRGLERAKHFTLENMTEKILDAIHSVEVSRHER